MAARMVYVDEIADGRAVATGERARHLSRVVRLQSGEPAEVSDFRSAWKARAATVEPQLVTFELNEELPPEPPRPRIELALAVIKFARFEWAVEKAAELGADAVIPVVAERSDGGLVKAAARRADRWAKIAEEAAQQARRRRPPHVSAPIPLANALAREADARVFFDFDGRLLEPDHVANVQGEGAVLVLAGPEGGWTENETTLAREAGALAVGLGPHVLRAETAAMAGLAIVAQVLRQAAARMEARSPSP